MWNEIAVIVIVFTVGFVIGMYVSPSDDDAEN